MEHPVYYIFFSICVTLSTTSPNYISNSPGLAFETPKLRIFDDYFRKKNIIYCFSQKPSDGYRELTWKVVEKRTEIFKNKIMNRVNIKNTLKISEILRISSKSGNAAFLRIPEPDNA